MLGTNRDEVKLFMAFSSDRIDKTMGMPSSFNDLARYDRDNRYGTDSWKIRAVDDLANAMSESGNEDVYAYRFDVDDWRSLGFIDLKDLLGAAHALEIPFVFSNFPKPLRIIFPDSMHDEFNVVAKQMGSYWAEFAYTGSPGKGRSGHQTQWQVWDNSDQEAARLMVFDTESDQGIRMVSDRLSISDLRQRLVADTTYRLQKDHCSAYKNLFRGDAFVEEEYLSLGKDGCMD
jgi:para-nitrobenzyl esterase